MRTLTVSQENDNSFRITADGLDSGLLTRDEALGELARSIYATWHTSYLKPCSPRPAPVVTDALNEAERQQAKAWLKVANLLTRIAPGWATRAPSASDSALVWIMGVDSRIKALREEIAKLKAVPPSDMKLIASNAELIPGRQYWCKSKTHGDIELHRCYEEGDWKYLGRSRIWAMDDNNQALDRWHIVGPVPEVGPINFDDYLQAEAPARAPAVDTLVEVRNTIFDEWILRYSAGTFKDNKLYCWDYGATSKTTTRYCSWVQWRYPANKKEN